MRPQVALAGTALMCAVALMGCQSSIDGTATRGRDSDSHTEPDFPTPRQTRPTAPPSTTPSAPPAPPTTPGPPGGAVLQPQNGYVFIQTKTGKTRCQLNTREVGCESAFTNAPEIDGLPANGVRLSADGDLSWVVGNLGDIPATTLDYRSYSAVGWTIDADQNGTRFTNDRTGHGMVISVEGVESF